MPHERFCARPADLPDVDPDHCLYCQAVRVAKNAALERCAAIGDGRAADFERSRLKHVRNGIEDAEGAWYRARMTEAQDYAAAIRRCAAIGDGRAADFERSRLKRGPEWRREIILEIQKVLAENVSPNMKQDGILGPETLTALLELWGQQQQERGRPVR